MKRRVLNILNILLIVLSVIGLNLVLYTEEGTDEENESNGNRSTNSARRYGTRAFYLLLEDLGYRVVQLEEPLQALRNRKDIRSVFIISPPIPYAQEELAALEDWVKAGGYLVIIDREIDWTVAGGEIKMSTYSRYKQWRLPRVKQPTVLTAGVNRVQLTEYASGVKAANAPITEHVGDQQGLVLIDFRYGDGRIVLLGEPYIVANNGIMASDNLTLALNIVRDMPSGVIAFDEYHHGYGTQYAGRTGVVGVLLNLYDYFKGTPVLWVFLQLSLVAMAMIYSRGRRFARPTPLFEPKRTRSLEYVASLASLARRMQTREFALENAYRSFRRRVASAIGIARQGRVQSSSPHTHQARIRSAEVKQLLARCEQLLRERRMTDAELITLVKHIRMLEAELRHFK
jgi:hypothetical protein